MAALRRFGIDVQLDLHHASSAGVDWTRFGAKAVADCEWVIVALSPAWRDRWEGRNDPTVGAGVASEADALLSIYNGEGQDAFRRKLVLVILPSMRAEARVPSGLHGVQRFAISEFSLSGLEGLLRLLTGQPKHVAEPLGTIPELPPAVVASPLLDVEAGPAAGPAPASGTADRLVALLADRDSDVRYEAMSALGDRLSPDLLPVIEPLIDDADKYVRRMAVEYFGQLSGAPGTSRLVALLADRDSDVRYEAMSALGDRLSPDLLPVIEPLIDDADKYVRRMAVEYFGQLSG